MNATARCLCHCLSMRERTEFIPEAGKDFSQEKSIFFGVSRKPEREKMAMVREFKVLGIKVHRITLDETVERIGEFVKERKPRLLVTLGTEMVMAAQKNAEFRKVLNNADLVCADAVGIVWAARKLGAPLEEKVAGIDVLGRIAEMSEREGWRLFFLGAAEGMAESAIDALRSKYPRMLVAGHHHGYFSDDGPVKKMIKEASPDVLFIALGSPRQELWFWKNKDELLVPVGIGVGGSFDVLSGKLRRSPQWMINLGLEWLYRLYLEPWRWKRMMVLPLFALRILLAGKQRASAAEHQE
jgi:N-acetylglucosaminyldiphosphoundecaprenol N-acetyl-beta-D-mannosaminyltransferase